MKSPSNLKFYSSRTLHLKKKNRKSYSFLTFSDSQKPRNPNVYSSNFAEILHMTFASFSNRMLYLLVRIAVSPQIAPISFGEEPVNAGDLVSVQCVVTKGDFPLEITWTFDGRPIQSYHGDVIVSDTGKRVKQLTIESVAARHAGEYTCVASNAAGSVSHSAVLDVNGITFRQVYDRDSHFCI